MEIKCSLCPIQELCREKRWVSENPDDKDSCPLYRIIIAEEVPHHTRYFTNKRKRIFIMEIQLDQAKNIANSIINYISPCCEKIEAVGSIRREKRIIHDIDILLILKSSESENLSKKLEALKVKNLAFGNKTWRFMLGEIQIDLYFAIPENYEMLKLVRTGSADHNIGLATTAKKMGYHLCFSGEGLLNSEGTRIAGDTEESIFSALKLDYKEPKERR